MNEIMPDPIIVVAYDPNWSKKFREIALPMRQAMGNIALRIDHIGSTSIPYIAAKPVIDIQISVANFEPFNLIREPLESLGYIWSANNPDKTKRYFRAADGGRSLHIHVRKLGSWSEQYSLLFRDYLRANPKDRDKYGNLKLELAEKFRHNRAAYSEAKDPLIWEITKRAHFWSWESGWEAGSSDL
jgi:GrpB-like predicted nucleotidyltransferase (UPF0157 family)